MDIEIAAAALGASDRAADAFTVLSPGRVNIIGDHIDYSGGQVLPMALDRGTTAVVFPRTDRLVRGVSASFPRLGVVTASLDDTAFRGEHGWFSYVLGVVDAAARAGVDMPFGFDVHLSGNIPRGGGLSSSASVELAAAIACERLYGAGFDATRWALLSQEAENDYVGVACGIMDQLSIARGREGMAILMDCRTLECDYVPVPADRVSVVVASTNHPRRLAESAYNDRRASVATAARVIGEELGFEVKDLVAVTPEQLSAASPALRAAGVEAFARHTVTEQLRVIAAADALRRGDLAALGRLMRESHESLRDDFAVTGEHLDALAEAAWATPGVIGARMTGAGFGGCTVNVVAVGEEQRVCSEIRSRYLESTGIKADTYVVHASEGAHVV